jgi:two-component system, OmpR family, response regulator ChvI
MIANVSSRVDEFYADSVSTCLSPRIKVIDNNEASSTNKPENYCVTVVDIVGSTQIVSTIGNPKNVRNFYEIFINTMVNTLRRHHAKVIKTVGDGIISYFPDTIDSTNSTAFENVLECCTAQIEQGDTINNMLRDDRLPSISYRVSADYGKLTRVQLDYSDNEDLFGSTVNFCSKINSRAPPNGIIIGHDLYQVIRSLRPVINNYVFNEFDSCYCGLGKYSYATYLVSRGRQQQRVISSVESLYGSLKGIKKSAFEAITIKKNRIPKILLIDDEIDDLFVLQNFLTLAGFEVETFSSSREALRHYIETEPSTYDLIISDIRMPELNGFQLYSKLRAVKHDVKILFSTCLEIAEEMLTLLPDLKPEQLIQKPVEKEKFIEIVKKNVL